MAPWLEVMLVCGLLAMLAPLPLILADRATGRLWLGVAWGTALALLATVLLGSES